MGAFGYMGIGEGIGIAGLNKDDRAAATPEKAGDARAAKRRNSGRPLSEGEPQIGLALRSVYDRTVSEAIPSDLLDLLGRLD